MKCAEQSVSRATGWTRYATTILFLFFALAPAASTRDSERLFVCPDGSMFVAALDPRAATLHTFGEIWDLAAVPAARGAKYSALDITLSMEGNTAVVERNGQVEFRDCVSGASAAGQPGRRDEGHAIRGTVSYRERIISIPPTAVLIVRLEEVSAPQGTPQLISEARYPVTHPRRRPKDRLPVRFELSYDPERIQPSARYQVSARIVDGDRLFFVTETACPVITGFPNRADLLLRPVSSVSAAPKQPQDHPRREP